MKVILADDEPFILQGLSQLIDWEAQGCEIVGMASNGCEVLEILKKTQVDLIISDIRMPEMTGLELLEKIRGENLSDAHFLILSGYNDFAYAQKAIRYSCMDYLLKPVQKELLLEQIQKLQKKLSTERLRREEVRKIQKEWFSQCLHDLFLGRQSPAQMEYLNTFSDPGQGEKFRCLILTLEDLSAVEELSAAEQTAIRQAIVSAAEVFLGEDRTALLPDMSGLMEDYEAGLLFHSEMAGKRGLTPEAFLEALAAHLNRSLPFAVALLAGKCVDDLDHISRSWSSASMLRPFRGFSSRRQVYYYEKEIHTSGTKVVLCKESLDRLLESIEQNDAARISADVDALFLEMNRQGLDQEMISMNTNYLLFQMIHLAARQDESVDQEEIMAFISDHVFQSGLTRGSREHLKTFCGEYAEYLRQLRKNVSGGVLSDVERDIREHYAENLTLRGLSRKYYLNSSYLGQIFRKKYGQSFKDYLTGYRIRLAADLLLRTDKKIVTIAEEVGYRDTDYFIKKFIEQYGCTPGRYRRSGGQP